MAESGGLYILLIKDLHFRYKGCFEVVMFAVIRLYGMLISNKEQWEVSVVPYDERCLTTSESEPVLPAEDQVRNKYIPHGIDLWILNFSPLSTGQKEGK